MFTDLNLLFYAHVFQFVDVLCRLEGLLRLLILVKPKLCFAEAKEYLLGGSVAAMSCLLEFSARILKHFFGLAPVGKSYIAATKVIKDKGVYAV